MSLSRGIGMNEALVSLCIRCTIVLLATNNKYAETVFVWTAPPPAWNQTVQGTDNIQTAVVEVLNGSVNYHLRWNYTLLDGQSILSVNLAIGDGIGQPDDIALIFGESATIFDRNDYRTRFSVESTSNFSTLIISKVTEKENATFQCRISLTEGSTWAYNARIFITVPPAITNISPNQTVTEGDNVTLICEAAVGKPNPSITWTKVSDNSVITFALVISRQDQGYFRCTANNSVGNPATKDVFVTVHYPPDITHISGNVTVNQTDSVILNCIPDGNPKPNVTWTRGSDNSVVTFPLNITGKGDEGAYTCTARNGVRESFSKDTFIIVKNYGPFNTSLVPDLSGNTVVVDSPFNLTCSAVASPLPRYRFSRDGISLNTSAVELYTTSVSEKRSPVSYSCTPFNDYGEGRTEKITLTVYYPPFATPKESRITAPVGSVQVISCHVLGNPPPNITWYKGDIVSDSRLTIHEKQFNITAISNETYICSANNSLGSATARVDVVVYVDVETKYVTMKITLTIRDMDCSEFTEVLKERFRNEALRLLNSYGITDVKITIRCGSVIVDLELSFTRSVTVDQVVKTLKEAASKKDFGDFKVDPESIGETGKAVSPTEPHCEESFIKKADCSVNVVIVAVIAVVAVIVVAFVAGVIGWWIHKRRKCRKDPRIHHSESEVLHDQNDIEDGAYARVNGGYADSGPPSANGTAQPKEAGSNNTDVPAEQAAAAPPAYAVVDKSKKKDKDKQNIPDYAVVDKSKKKKKKKPEVEDPYAEVEDPKKDKDKKTTDPSTHDYAMVDKSKKKKKETDENAYATVDKSKKSKKGQQKPKFPGEVLYADLGDFQPVQPLPTVSTSPEPLAPVKRPTPYQGTEYADITQFLKGNATLPEGQSTEMQPTYANAGGGQGAAANKENANTGGEGDIEPKETPM